MQTGAHGDGIAFPRQLGAVFPVADGVAALFPAPDRENRARQVDARPQVKVIAILVQILDVALGTEEVRVVLARPEVGEAGELLGGD